MRIQCSCGSKDDIEVTPDMAKGPVHFVCSSCGLDASEYVTSLVHRELAFAGIPTASAPAAAPAHAGVSNIAPPPPGYSAPPSGYGSPTVAPVPVAAGVPVARAVSMAAPLPAAVAAPVAAAPAAAPASRLRVQVAAPAQPRSSEEQPMAETGEFPRCLKHGGELAMERCYVCSKPICPKCMAM